MLATATINHDVYCALCDEVLPEDSPTADHHVYKCGELDSIELAHVDCAAGDNADSPRRRWQWRYDGDAQEVL